MEEAFPELRPGSTTNTKLSIMSAPAKVENTPVETPDAMEVESCRSCSTGFNFRLSQNITVTVICGRPPPTSSYEAVSYLWENGDNPTRVRLICQNQTCKAEKVVKVRDAQKLKRILEFVSVGDVSCSVWIDALSIDQEDEEDKKRQLAVMGDIYRHAEIVSVLFPVGDEMAYERLRALAKTAGDIVKYHDSGGMNRWGLEDGDESLEKMLMSFKSQIRDWGDKLPRVRYFTRAWTFQEWVMASELECTSEIASHKEVMGPFKNNISTAASIVGLRRSSQARLERISPGNFSDILRIREKVGVFLNEVRLYFPFADALIADSQLEDDDLRAQTFIAPKTQIDSGTYVTEKPSREEQLSIRAMLSLALNAFTMSPRVAFYPADLVQCWASMCNIQYEYSEKDSTALTLHKTLAALRMNGLKIFNFHVNTTGGVTDLTFERYVAAMRQTNSDSRGFIFGSPAFTGRADTISHLKMCLEPTIERAEFVNHTNVHLRAVKNAIIDDPILLQDTSEVISAFDSLISGSKTTDGIQDVIPLVKYLLKTQPNEVVDTFMLITVSIPIIDNLTINSFKAWAICPLKYLGEKLFVAREDLNGTLVLAIPSPTYDSASIVAYLNTSHQRDGIYLVKSDGEGVVDIVFRKQDDPLLDPAWVEGYTAGLGGDVLDFGMLGVVDDRAFDVKIELGDGMLEVVG